MAGGVALAVSRDEVVAFDPDSGAMLWTARRAVGVLTPPAIDPTAGVQGIAVFIEGTSETDSAIVGLDLSTHQRRWTVHLQKPALGAPSIADGAVYVGGRDGFVYALDVATGGVRWKTHTVGIVDTSPAVSGGLVVAMADDPVTGRSRLYGLDAATGERTWTYSPPGLSVGATAASIVDGRVFAGFGDHTVRAFDLRTGRVIWDEAVRDVFSPFTAPAVAGGIVYAADDTGGLYAFVATTGARRWDFAFRGNVLIGSPVVLGRDVVLGLSDGTLAAVDMGSGALVWETVYRAGAVGLVAPTGHVLLAPVVGQGGGIVGLERDPAGHLMHRDSPTRLHLPLALGAFGAAFVIALVAIAGLFRLLSGRAWGPPPEPGFDAVDQDPVAEESLEEGT